MNMPKFFRSRRPKHAAIPAPKLDVRDLLVARWHGLTPDEWCDLPSLAKVDHRETYARAWRL